MTPRFININGLNLAYYVKNEDKPNTIFFVHGNSISSVTWRKQFSDNQLSNYRLIALDLPAHGLSDASPNPEQDYSLPGLARIVSEVISLLVGDEPYVIAGISLGANLVAELVALNIQPKGVVLAGPSILGADVPVSEVVKPNTHVYTVFTDDAPLEDVIAYSKEGSPSPDPADHDLFVQDYRRVKPPFRSALNRSLENRAYNDEIQLMAVSEIPQCVIFGADERVVVPGYLDNVGLPLWQAKVHQIPGASHLVNVDRPEEFNRLLATFAGEVFR